MAHENAEIIDENLRLREEVSSLKLEVNELLAKLRFISGQRFATSQSEKVAPLQGSLFNEAEIAADAPVDVEPIKVGSHEKKRKQKKAASGSFASRCIQARSRRR